MRPAGPSLDSLFCGRLPSFFPGLSTLPCHGSALTVREKAVHAKAVYPLILRKSPLATDGSAGSPYAPFSAWLPCVRLRRCRPAACGRWCGPPEATSVFLCRHRLSRRRRDFFPKLPPALLAGRCKPLCPACPLKVLQFNRYIPICYWLKNFSRQKMKKSLDPEGVFP